MKIKAAMVACALSLAVCICASAVGESPTAPGELNSLLLTAELVREAKIAELTEKMARAKKEADHYRKAGDLTSRGSDSRALRTEYAKLLRSIKKPNPLVPWLHPEYVWKIGDAGMLAPLDHRLDFKPRCSYKAKQVISNDSALIDVNPGSLTFIMRDISTEGWTDGMRLPDEILFQFYLVAGTEQYVTVAGGTKTVPVVRRIEVSQDDFLGAQKESLRKPRGRSN